MRKILINRSLHISNYWQISHYAYFCIKVYFTPWNIYLECIQYRPHFQPFTYTYAFCIFCSYAAQGINHCRTGKICLKICDLHTLCIFRFFWKTPSRGQKSVMIFFEKFRPKYLEISRFLFNFAVQIKLSLIWKSLWTPTNSPTYFSHAWFLNM